ncbi:DNA-directed RNA polymerase subunit beta [Paenibacillus sp. 481]|uniref:DNA-directed RNA polymerase subunit beta n=1 Tax=Paenibacillus sp. 481 TaxID=2835869 RepID=UPI001E58EB19|nr:DNA-directed RNA polymerase subunit beta [Paenibacillus sp. 481]UHA75685.1 DNA-directed RNA polymerase subunit beta [Paenibacillus sp. 481]
MSRETRTHNEDGLPNQTRSSRLRRAERGRRDESSNSQKQNRRLSPRMRWIFRLVIVPLICLLTLYSGMVVGYVTVGNGTFSEALKINTWLNLFKLAFG